MRVLRRESLRAWTYPKACKIVPQWQHYSTTLENWCWHVRCPIGFHEFLAAHPKRISHSIEWKRNSGESRTPRSVHTCWGCGDCQLVSQRRWHTIIRRVACPIIDLTPWPPFTSPICWLMNVKVLRPI